MPGTDDIDAMLEEMFEAQGMKPAVRANIMKLPDDKKWLMLQGFRPGVKRGAARRLGHKDPRRADGRQHGEARRHPADTAGPLGRGFYRRRRRRRLVRPSRALRDEAAKVPETTSRSS